MKVTIASRNPKSKKFPVTLDIEGTVDSITTNDIQKALAAKFPTYYPDRQRLTTENKKALALDQTLASQGITAETRILFKDLGPQISWRVVFMIEYFGPILIHPFFYYLPKLVYGQDFVHSPMQTASYYMVLAHFLKREFETMFIHRFSHGTMPFRNVFKNSAHYWLLSGVNLAYWVYGPWFAQGKSLAVRNDVWLYGSIAVFVWAELSNFITHYTLRNLRPPGTRVRNIPYGYGFDLVSCPNYLFEFIAWTAVCFLTTSWSAFLFNIVATGQMYIWAVKKHKNYKKEFKEYPRNRTAMFPFIA